MITRGYKNQLYFNADSDNIWYENSSQAAVNVWTEEEII